VWILLQQQLIENPMEKEIKITAQLYKCRDTAKRFFREEYAKKLMPYIEIIKQVMKVHNLEVLEAILKISETKTYLEDGIVQLLFMAAAVEMMEPSEEFLNQTKEQ
jgi:hypothetical protein